MNLAAHACAHDSGTHSLRPNLYRYGSASAALHSLRNPLSSLALFPGICLCLSRSPDHSHDPFPYNIFRHNVLIDNSPRLCP